MHIVSTEFLAYNDSLINLLLVIIAILGVLSLALIGYAAASADDTKELEDEIKRLQRRIDRLTQQNKTINK